MTTADRYRRWFEYEQDAHQKVLASLRGVPLANRASDWFQNAVDLFAHMMAARRMWLFRLGIISAGPPDLFPRGVAFETLEPLANEVHELWSRYLERLDDGALARVVEYRATEGPRYKNTVEDILSQLFGHSWYHRGQIAQLVRAGGAEPAVTDFVFWTREAAGEDASFPEAHT